MWQNVTSFLEAVDQKAGEIASTQDEHDAIVVQTHDDVETTPGKKLLADSIIKESTDQLSVAQMDDWDNGDDGAEMASFRQWKGHSEAHAGEQESRMNSLADELHRNRDQVAYLQEELAEAEGTVLQQRRELSCVLQAKESTGESNKLLQLELTTLKVKSRLALDEKDKLLKQLQAADVSREDVSQCAHVDAAEVESQRQTIHQLKCSVDEYTRTIEQGKQELGRLERKYEAEKSLAFHEKESSETQLQSLHSTVKHLTFQVEEQNANIILLGKKARQQNSTVEYAEVERRCKELAEIVLEKQSALEAKRFEVDQWRTRYELAQQRAREAELLSSALPTRSNHRALFMDDTNLVEPEENHFFGRLAGRGNIGAKISSVASRLDQASLKTGSVLRRYSSLRIFFVAYVVVLQVWVFVAVSFSSIPTKDNSNV